MRWLLVILLLLTNTSLYSQTKIFGRVIDSDSNSVPFATLRLGGLDVTQTSENGYFEFDISRIIGESHYIKPGIDLPIDVEKEGWAVLDPADREIRMPEDWNVQKHFTIVIARKGSPVFYSEQMLEYVMRKRIEEAVKAKEEVLASRDILAEEAERLGLDKDELLTAIEEFKDRMRTSPDLYESGLAALYDAHFASVYSEKKSILEDAKSHFRRALIKDEADIQEGQLAQKRLPDICTSLGIAFYLDPNYDSAKHYFQMAIKFSPENSIALRRLGITNSELAKYDEAITDHMKAFEIDSVKYGWPNRYSIGDLNNLAIAYTEKSDYQNAINTIKRIVDLDSMKSHINPSDMASIMNSTASVYSALGLYDVALETYNNALSIWRCFFKSDNPYMAIALNNIGTIYAIRYEDSIALAMYYEALNIYIEFVGRNSPLTARVLHNIGRSYYNQEHYDSAFSYYLEALEIVESNFGQHHPMYIDQLDDLGILVLAIGDLQGAYEIFNKEMLLILELYGPSHPKISAALNSLAHFYMDIGKLDLAMASLNEAVKININHFGGTNLAIATYKGNIGLILSERGKKDSALQVFSEVRDIIMKYHNERHPSIADCYANMAIILADMGKIDEAIEHARKALDIYREFFKTEYSKAIGLKGRMINWQNSIKNSIESNGK